MEEQANVQVPDKAAARPMAILSGGLIAAALIGATPAAAVPTGAHWGQFKWDAGATSPP